jgi:hypothetical protein
LIGFCRVCLATVPATNSATNIHKTKSRCKNGTL